MEIKRIHQQTIWSGCLIRKMLEEQPQEVVILENVILMQNLISTKSYLLEKPVD